MDIIEIAWHAAAIDRAHEQHGQWLNLARRHRAAGRPGRAWFAIQRASRSRQTIVGHRAAMDCTVKTCSDQTHIHPFVMS